MLENLNSRKFSIIKTNCILKSCVFWSKVPQNLIDLFIAKVSEADIIIRFDCICEIKIIL